MGGRTYERLSVEDFGAQLLKSGDLDPVYVALNSLRGRAIIDDKTLHRWLLAYWCFYDSGFACWAAENKFFWGAMELAAKNEIKTPFGARWPRGKERRHFRGKTARVAIEKLCDRYPDKPEAMAEYCAGLHLSAAELTTCSDIMKRVQEHEFFGPWIGFKIADMIDRVMMKSVDFSEAEVLIFDQPREAALEVWRRKSKLPDNAEPKDPPGVIHMVILHLREHFKDTLAPPAMDRPVGLQEIETILCKWKSHVSGHYPINNDIIEIRHGLEPWLASSVLAKNFLACLPKP